MNGSELLTVVNLLSSNGFAGLILPLRIKQDMTQIRSFILGRKVGGPH